MRSYRFYSWPGFDIYAQIVRDAKAHHGSNNSINSIYSIFSIFSIIKLRKRNADEINSGADRVLNRPDASGC